MTKFNCLIYFITREASTTRACIPRANQAMRLFLPLQIKQFGHYHHMQLATTHNAEISIHAPLLLASSNTVIIMFDFEPFNSVITTHYFSVFFDLHSLKLKNSDFFMLQ